MATRIEQHIQDDCLTAEQVMARAYKTSQWHKAAFPRAVVTIQREVPAVAPDPIIEAPETKPEIKPDWRHCGAASRRDKWPSTFIRHVKSLVAKEFLIDVIDIDATRRMREHVIPRHVAIYLCKVLTRKSLPEIGRKFYRDHTTILHAIREMPRRMREDWEICEIVYRLQCQLEHDLAEWRNRK